MTDNPISGQRQTGGTYDLRSKLPRTLQTPEPDPDHKPGGTQLTGPTKERS